MLMFAAGCGGGGDDDAPDSKETKPPSAQQRAEVSRDRLAGSTSSDTAAGEATAPLGSCLVAAGFAPAPPGHGIVAQWTHSDGTVVAQSTDPAQATTQAAEFASGTGTPEVVGDGVIVAGSGAAADAARACATT